MALSVTMVGMLNGTAFCMFPFSFVLFKILNSYSSFYFLVPPERNVFYRENADGSYSSLSFYLMYTLWYTSSPLFFSTINNEFSEIAYDIFMAISFSSVMFFVIGMEFQWDVFSMFCFIMFLMIFTGSFFLLSLPFLVFLSFFFCLSFFHY